MLWSQSPMHSRGELTHPKCNVGTAKHKPGLNTKRQNELLRLFVFCTTFFFFFSLATQWCSYLNNVTNGFFWMNLFQDNILASKICSFHTEETSNQNAIQLVQWLLFNSSYFLIQVSWMFAIQPSISIDSKGIFQIRYSYLQC